MVNDDKIIPVTIHQSPSTMIDSRPFLLKHLLLVVPFDGWTDASLAEAAQKAGLDAQKLFPGGPIDCIDCFFASEDEALASAVSARELAEMRIPQRIETLVMTRLARLAPHREAVRRAVAFYALPWNTAHGMRALYRTVDSIWRLAGDQSLDFNFYTKRATLAGIYSTTSLFWLNDGSADYAETKEFLNRRLANVAGFGKWKKNLTSKFKRA